MTDHDPRCERSTSDPKRCRCQCEGAQHGRVHRQLELDLRSLLTHIAGELDAYLAGRADAELAEGIPL